MAQQEVYDSAWFRNRNKVKPLPKEMTGKEYLAYVNKNPLANVKGKSIKQSITQALDNSGLPYSPEHKFSPDRKFRFDWAILTTHCKIGIEYDGLMSKKSRHTTITGFTKDHEKFNLAASMGWIVLRYTALNYQSMMKDVLGVIERSVKK